MLDNSNKEEAMLFGSFLFMDKIWYNLFNETKCISTSE